MNHPYSFSHNHGSVKSPSMKGNYYSRDPFFTSMIMGGRVSTSQKKLPFFWRPSESPGSTTLLARFFLNKKKGGHDEAGSSAKTTNFWRGKCVSFSGVYPQSQKNKSQNSQCRWYFTPYVDDVKVDLPFLVGFWILKKHLWRCFFYPHLSEIIHLSAVAFLVG